MEEYQQIYKRNFLASYDKIMNKYVPSCSIFSCTIGIFVSVLLIRQLLFENRRLMDVVKLTNDSWQALFGFVCMSSLSQINSLISSSLFLYNYDRLIIKNITVNNHLARACGFIYIWTRLANSCLIFIMLLYALNIKHFILWRLMVSYCIVAPFFLSLYAVIMDLIGFNYSQLPINCCSIMMSPLNKSFELELLWNYAIEVTDFAVFVFCTYLIILSTYKYPDRLIINSNGEKPVISHLSGLMIVIPCVMMISKCLEVIRTFMVSFFFLKMSESNAHQLGTAGLIFMILQSLTECMQPILTWTAINAFVNEKTRWLNVFRNERIFIF